MINCLFPHFFHSFFISSILSLFFFICCLTFCFSLFFLQFFFCFLPFLSTGSGRHSDAAHEIRLIGCQHVDGTNRRIQSVLFLNRKCIFKTLSTWLMDVNNLDFTSFTTEKSKIHCICCRCFVGRYELQHYKSSAVQLGAFLWACPFKIMLQ